jgi:hypothetical protein
MVLVQKNSGWGSIRKGTEEDVERALMSKDSMKGIRM